MKTEKIKEVLRLVKPSSIVDLLQQGIEMEKLTLEANEHLLNEYESDVIRNKIADGKIFISLLRGDITP